MVAGPWYKISPSQGTFSNTSSTMGSTFVISFPGDYGYDGTDAPVRLTAEQIRSLKQRIAAARIDRTGTITVDTISHKYQRNASIQDVQPPTSGDTRSLGVRRASSISGTRYCAYLYQRKDLYSQHHTCLESRQHQTHNRHARPGKNSGLQFRPKRFLCSARTKAQQQL